MTGARITTLDDLMIAVAQRRAVVYGRCKRPVPAAFIVNWQAWRLHRLMTGNGLFLYELSDRHE